MNMQEIETERGMERERKREKERTKERKRETERERGMDACKQMERARARELRGHRMRLAVPARVQCILFMSILFAGGDGQFLLAYAPPGRKGCVCAWVWAGGRAGWGGNGVGGGVNRRVRVLCGRE